MLRPGWSWKIQLQLANEGFSKVLFNLENKVHSRLDDFLLQHELMYRDRCKVNWLAHGDRNSTYFHNILKVRKAHKPIDALNINGSIVLDKAIISGHIVDFYFSLFKEDDVVLNCDLEDVTTYSVIDQNNVFFGFFVVF